MANRFDIMRRQMRRDVFHAVAHPVRRAIIERLAEGEAEAGELADIVWDRFFLQQPTTSNHLRFLREAAIVDCAIDETYRLYTLRADALAELREWVGRFGDGRGEGAPHRPTLAERRFANRRDTGIATVRA